MPSKSGKPNRRAMWELYKDAAGEFRWRLLSANGRIIADSGEGFATKGGAVISARTVATHAARAVFP
jgi:uncharacterized protein YegP (UPF0339 family)